MDVLLVFTLVVFIKIGIVTHHFSRNFNRVIISDLRQNFVSAQNLENIDRISSHTHDRFLNASR